jgi:amino acid adenylation domain-containing protein/non-ribosomal peptide synthase protein (TIGR01720 family)
MLNHNPDALAYLPISEYQKRYFLEWALAPNDNTYNVSLVNKIAGSFNDELFKQACWYFVKQNEVMHARYSDDGAHCFYGNYAIDDFYYKKALNIAESAESQIRGILDTPFDLTKDVLLRLVLLVPDDPHQDSYFIIVAHHIIGDAISALQISSQIQQHYNALIKGEPSGSALDKTFSAAVSAEQKIINDDYKIKAQKYWLDFIGELPLNITLPYRSGVNSTDLDSILGDKSGGFIFFGLSEAETAALKAYAKQEKTTIFIVLSAIYGLVLSKYSNQDKILLSYPVNMRPRGFNDVTGCFVNNLPLKLEFDEAGSLSEIIEALGEQRRTGKAYQGYSLTDVIHDQRVYKNRNTKAFFNAGITQANLNAFSIKLDGAEVTSVEISNSDKIVHEMGLLYDEYSSDIIKFKFEYRTLLFEKTLIERFIDTFKRLLIEVVNGQEVSIKKPALLSTTERQEIVYSWNSEERDYALDHPLGKVFSERALSHPEAIALVYEDQEVTYGELDRRSGMLAHHIRSEYKNRTGAELAAGSFIGLYLGRSIELITGMLAILKAGGAYVPIDINYPEDRVKYILSDTGAVLVLSLERHLTQGAAHVPVDKMLLIDYSNELYQMKDSFELPVQNTVTDLAYVIYTSGTTGQPKGVMIEHRSVMNYVYNVGELLAPEIRNVDFSTNITFDLTVTTTICALLLGKKVFIYPGDLRDTDDYANYLVRNRIDFLKGTPSFLVNLSPAYFTTHAIRQAFIGGEKLSQHQLTHLLKYIKEPVDEYGPTETTVGATVQHKGLGNNRGIGKAYHNYRLYVLSPEGQPLPVGVWGELYIGGAGVARGYLNQAALTVERFVANPFASPADQAKGYERLYRTGDVVRWQTDGSLEYQGRNDDQVKIRGYRVEPGEVEQAFSAVPGVGQCSVLYRERQTESGSVGYLVGYYVPENAGGLSEETITGYLSGVLPDYMLPSAYVVLNSMPLTANGKLDKRALPEPLINPISSKYVAPTNEIEAKLCMIWQQVLGIDHVGITDEFFRIGGDSILSIQASGKIRKAGFECQVRDIFECKTVSNLAERIRGKGKSDLIVTEQGLLTGTLELLPIQKWFLEKAENAIFSQPNHWNQSFLIKVPVLDLTRLDQAVKQLSAYHDVMHSAFIKESEGERGSWKMIYKADAGVNALKVLNIHDLSDAEIQHELTAWQSHFDLESGNLFQAGYLYGYEDGSARIFFALHHMIVDTVSWRILLEDIKALYEGEVLPPKGSSYRQWTTAIKTYPLQHVQEAEWWSKQVIDNSVQYPEATEATVVDFELNRSVTASLLQNASKAYYTEINDLLLTALCYALKEINAADIQAILLEGHGREPIDVSLDVSRTVGWFTTMFPVKLELQDSIGETIVNIKEIIRQIPAKGFGFGCFATASGSGFSYDQLPMISFNYLGQLGNSDDEWRIIPVNSGTNIHPDNQDHALININGVVTDGQLSFRVVTKLGLRETTKLAGCFKDQLMRVENHCVEKLARSGSSYTPSDFTTVNISQPLLNRLDSAAKISKNEITHIFPANSLQQGFIYHALSQPEDDAYRVQLLLDYEQTLDINAYVSAWNYSIAQYPILRTAFNWEEDIIQVIYKHGKADYQIHDISHLATSDEKEAAINAIQAADRKQGFDLSKPTLFRLHIIKQAPDYYTIIKSEHHSISDGWSGVRTLTSVHEYYDALMADKLIAVKEDSAYIKAQEYIVAHKPQVKTYWKELLADVDEANDISSLLNNASAGFQHTQVILPAENLLEVSGDLYKTLKVFCHEHGITLNVLVQFAWHKLLQQFSGRTKSIVGATLSGRDLPIDNIQDSVGLYINTLPVVVDWANDELIISQLHQLQQQVTAANTHSFADLSTLQKDGERLFHSLFIYENYPPAKNAENYKVSVRKSIEKVDYPLSVIAYEQANALFIKLVYDSKYLQQTKARQHLTRMEDILRQVTEDCNRSHRAISLLSTTERQEVVYSWNSEERDYALEHPLGKVFSERALSHPEAIALVYEDQEVTYGELDRRSGMLAHHIRSEYKNRTGAELAAGSFIGLYLGRSIELITGMLAILKAGGAYVPIDIHYPEDRVKYILSDTGAVLVLSLERHLTQGAVHVPVDKMLLIDYSNELYQMKDSFELPVQNTGADLAYVIYTSGTTGQPKGVMIEHRSVMNYVYNVGELLAPEIRNVDFSTNITFDLTVTTTICALLLGKKVFIYPGDLRDTDDYANYLVRNRIDFLKGTPSFLVNLSPAYFTTHAIRQAFIGGEKLSQHQLTHLLKYIKEPVDEYGPTETTVGATVQHKGSGNNRGIGKAYHNYRLYVLSPEGQPLPVGVWGELYIGGAGVARGYLNQAALTAERFVANPFASPADQAKGYERLYRTGDVVRWQTDGSLEYQGRNDDQVKIRGYRVEPGEVEQAFSAVPGVGQCSVLYRERQTESGSVGYLVGYYVAENAGGLSEETITGYLSGVLPDYMLPSAYVVLDSMPLTANGKLDKRALPEPLINEGHTYSGPVTALETAVCQIYSLVLGLAADQVSTQQNFFKMGGNSILSIQLKMKLNQLEEFKHITIADLYRYNTVDKLIQSIKKDNQPEYKLRQLQVEAHHHEIAIIGVSGAFSGAENVEELWQLIAGQEEGIRFYSKEECSRLGVDASMMDDPNYIPVAGKVKDIDLFDPAFWEMSVNEAKQLDPQIRKFVEHCWYSLESAGYAQSRKQFNIGVFAGSEASVYFYDHVYRGEMADQINVWEAAASNINAIATKTAYLLGLSGPANSINTACSTGLVSVVEACEKLHLGVCDMALAGGVSLLLPDQVGYIYQDGMILSKDGHCRTFDREASGTTGGSGVAVVLLKRLENAIADQDNILGVIKGYATNNDGDRKTGYTAPSVIGQSECIINAQLMADVKSGDIDYVECHGTGTHIGDPIEVQALRDAFKHNFEYKEDNGHKTILGAVKANIGHTDSAAGTAGLIKVVTMLQRQVIPGQVNYEHPNEEFQLEQTDFEIIKQNRSWPARPDRQRLAGVSSFGIGGTNAHVIVGDYKNEINPAEKTASGELRYVIPFSAKNRKSLAHYQQLMLQYLIHHKGQPDIRDIAYTLQERRESFNYRSAYSASSITELLAALEHGLPDQQTLSGNRSNIVFMFPGQGTQYVQMARPLYDNEPGFRKIVDQCIAIADKYTQASLRKIIYPGEERTYHNINETQWTQISLFIIEYALSKYLEHLGVSPDAYIGHSIGEYVAATLSGVFSLEDAIKVVIARGRLMQKMQPGDMLAVKSSLEFINVIAREYDCDIAVINSAEDIVLSGENHAIAALKATLDKQAIPNTILNTSHAYHSKMMEQAANEFEGVFRNVRLNKPVRNFISNLNGKIAGDEVTTASYWCRQLRNTVAFAPGIATLGQYFNHQVTFVEVGPGKNLSSFVNSYCKLGDHHSVNTVSLLLSAKEFNEMAGTPREIRFKEDIKAKLWSSGIIALPNDPALFVSAKVQQELPCYQFDRQKCWLEKKKTQIAADELKLLPEESWLSAPVWSSIENLQLSSVPVKPVYSNTLIFLKQDQLGLFDFSVLSANTYLVIFDTLQQDIDDMDTGGLVKINPVNEDHFIQLASYLKAQRLTFDAIIHLSSINNPENDLDIQLYQGFYSLFLIKQHLLKSSAVEHLLVLTNGLSQITGGEMISPANGMLVGAVRNINHELLNIDARIIDVGSNPQNMLNYIALLVKKQNYHKCESLLAIQYGKLWREVLQPVSEIEQNKTLNNDDVILITGGTGGLALSIASVLSRQHHLKFVLVSRSGISQSPSSAYDIEKTRLIEEIVSNGCTVDIACGDISDLNQVSAILHKVTNTLGNIAGIIHTAGVSPLKVQEYSLKNVQEAFKAKVYGIDNLLRLLAKNPPRFVAATSSLASVVGDINRIEYCAANSYLDYLAADKKSYPQTNFYSFNWPGLSDVGMIREQLPSVPETSRQLGRIEEVIQKNTLKGAEAGVLFYKLINQAAHNQVAISKLNIGILKDKLFKQQKSDHHITQVTLLEPEYKQEEYLIAQLFGEVLGVTQLSLNDDFFRLGGNSILAIRLSHLLNKTLSCEISPADLFTLKTVHNLYTSFFAKKTSIKGKEIGI